MVVADGPACDQELSMTSTTNDETEDAQQSAGIHDGTMDALLAIMAALRTPGSGCPWDLQQTNETIAPYTIEEAYEVADAITRGDSEDLKDELGDLLFQVVFYAQMAQEDGRFTFNDVVAGICDKMIRRHPHVFGDHEARTAGAVKGMWENIKADERARKSERRARDGDAPPAPSVLDNVPVGLPALSRAVKLQKRAARVGFDWPSVAPMFDKLDEEIAELRAEADKDSLDGILDEMGDVFFVCVNLALRLGVDPETAVRATNDKFTRRFKAVEAALRDKGSTPEQSSLEEMDNLWNEVKAREKS